MNIGMLIVMILGGALALFTTLYLIISLFIVLGYKVYRKFKYHISLYD